jgi:hypothetical protein
VKPGKDSWRQFRNEKADLNSNVGKGRLLRLSAYASLFID